MVYGAFVLFLDLLMIPFLRHSTSLGNVFRTSASKVSLELLYSVLPIIFWVGSACTSKVVDRFDGGYFVTKRTAVRVSSYRTTQGFAEIPHGLDSA